MSDRFHTELAVTRALAKSAYKSSAVFALRVRVVLVAVAIFTPCVLKILIFYCT